MKVDFYQLVLKQWKNEVVLQVMYIYLRLISSKVNVYKKIISETLTLSFPV